MQKRPESTTNHRIQQPRRRSGWRRHAGKWFYRAKRYGAWWLCGTRFAASRCAALPEPVFAHQSPLLRRLRAVDMQLQYNKITNLRLAAEAIDGLLIRPGEVFSFWKRVGRPTARRGFLEGMVLQDGRVQRGMGGGLCQMGNLLHWMVLHTPLTVTERWRHSYDVFPDEHRTLPFGSGATLAYNYIDLQFRNDTRQNWQIRVWLSDTHLHGALHCEQPLPCRYEVFEQAHWMQHEHWGGYSRHNVLARRIHQDGATLREEVLLENHALMMYSPFLNP
ncbi:MAG: VanW family protein [Saprospiraceae bacterium]|nr:VanW family protein [Saprospiraceae bacterium]